jgi:hypothetical protein
MKLDIGQEKSMLLKATLSGGWFVEGCSQTEAGITQALHCCL